MSSETKPLTIINWNILYEAERPEDKDRHTDGGQTTLLEQKAASSALAYFCYHDNHSHADPMDPVVNPADRQLVKQPIKGVEHQYYRGGSNANVRMNKVIENIKELAVRGDIVCLQEITPTIANVLEKTFKTTHQIFYSYRQGNNHGVMILVKQELDVVASHETEIQKGSGRRNVRVVDVRDPQTNSIVRIATAHLYGFHNNGQPVYQEASDLCAKVKQLPGKYDTVVLAADTNETKRAREAVAKQARELVATPAVHYAESSPEAGWRLHLQEQATGQVAAHPTPPRFGLCAIMLDHEHPSTPLTLSDLPPELSDHAPIGTRITIQPARHPSSAAPHVIDESLGAAVQMPALSAPAAVHQQPTHQQPIVSTSLFQRRTKFFSLSGIFNAFRSIWQWCARVLQRLFD